jgi:translation initiation factor IF-1
MSKNDYVEATGTITKLIPGGKFLVKLDQHNMEIIGHLSGKMRLNKINVLLNDKVTVELTPYDLTQARITFRHK